MKKPRVVLAATRSGSGKTVLTCAMIQALKKQKKKVASFKCGPDYIDPMFHKQILGVPSKNLDLFFSDEEMVRRLFLTHNEADISVVEGVMGLYDGLGGISEQASTYHLACALEAPIILVVNAHGMGRSVLAEIAGFLSMDREKRIKGVILNCISGMFYQMIKPVIEEELQILVLGYYERQKDIQLESRYLGLKLPNETKDLHSMLDKAADAFEKTVDLEKIIEIAEENSEIEEKPFLVQPITDRKVNIGVAIDEAFCFYYEDNLCLLKALGANIVPFSPLHDKELPRDLDGMILGGGYPELFAEQLEENTEIKEEICHAIQMGMPSLAECGGFMYLHDNIVTEDGTEHQMLGILPGKATYQNRLVRFGYIALEDKENQYHIKGHEFHYFDSTNNGDSCIATKPMSGRTWECAHVEKNHWWGFAHLYYPSGIAFAEGFIKKCIEWRER